MLQPKTNVMKPYMANRFVFAQTSAQPALRRAVACSCSIALMLMAAPRAVSAATITWSGTTSNAWSTTTNWNGGVTPGATSGTTNDDIALFNTNPTNKAPVWTTYLNLAGFTFDTANVGSFTIGTTSGSSAFLTSGGTTQLTTGVTTAQIINAPLVILNASGSNSGSYTFSNASTTSAASLTLGGAISGQATAGGTTSVVFGGQRSTAATADVISGALSDGSGGGSLALTVANSWGWTAASPYLSSGLVLTAIGPNLNFTGSSAFTGATTISGGQARLSGASGRFMNTSGLTVNGNGGFILGDATAATNNGVTNRINSAAGLTLGGANGAGTFTMATPAASSTSSQTFASLTVSPGANAIMSLATSSTGGVTNLIFTGSDGAGYVRNTNGIVNFTSGIGTATSSIVRLLGSGTVTMASTAGIQVGQPYTGTGFNGISSTVGPIVVQQILSATSILLSATATTTGTAAGTYYIAANNQTVQFTSAPTAAGGSSVSGLGADAILTGAILNGNDFATAVAGSASAATYVSSLTAGKNVNVTGNLSTSGNTSINSLRLGDTTQRTVTIGASDTLTIASGGILLPSSVVATNLNQTITGGSLTSGTGDLWIYSASGVWSSGGPRGNADPRGATYAATIASKITGDISVTVTGPADQNGQAGGQVVFSGSNDYTGGTYLAGGQIVVDADSRLGATTGAVTAVSGVNSIAPIASFSFDASRNFIINSGALLQIGGRGQTITIAGQVSGGGDLEIGYVSDGVRVILTATNSNFTGRYDVNGYLRATEGVGLSSNANLNLAGRGTYSYGVLETSGTFTRALGYGAGQVIWSPNGTGYSDGGFAAVGGPLTVNLGGDASPATLTQNSGGFLSGNNGLVLQSNASDNGLTWVNPINNNGAALVVTQAASTSGTSTAATMTGVISGAGGFTKNGAGLLALSGTNTFTGKTSIRNGSLSVAAIGSVSGTGNLGAPTTSANGTIDFGTTTTAATLVYTGSGETTDRVVNLAGTTGGATLDQSGSGLLRFSSALTATGSGAKALTLQGSTAGTGEIAGLIVDYTGAGGPLATRLTKAGTGTWTLSGANTYTGTTTISSGVLSVSSLANGGLASNIGAPTNAAANLVLGGGSLQYTGTTVTTDRSFTLNASTTSTIDVATAGTTLTLTGSTTVTTGALTKAGAGTLALAGAAAYTGATAINAGTLQIGNGSTTGGLSASSAISIASGATLAFNRTDNYGGNFANAISGSGGIMLTSGSLTLSTAKTYTGQTTVSGGTLLAGIANAFGSSAPLAVNSGTVNLAGFSQTVGALSGSAGTLITTGTAAGSATLTTSFASGTSTFAGSIANNVSGTVAFTKNGAGTQILSGTNTYTGNTTVSGGQLNVTGAYTGAAAGSRFYANGGSMTFDMGTGSASFYGDNFANAQQVAQGAFTSQLTLQSGTLNVLTQTGAGASYGSLNLGIANASANGSLTVNGGSLNVDGRILMAANAGAGPQSTLTINGGQVNLGNAGLYSTATNNGVLRFGAGVSTVNLNGGTLSMIGTVNDSPAAGSIFNFNGGTLKAVGANADFLAVGTNMNVNVKSGGAIIDDSGFAVTITKALLDGTGGGGLTKLGSGTLTLSATNTYTGNTRVSAGTLSITNATGLQNSTLDMNAADSGSISFGQNSTLGGLTGSRDLNMGTRTLSVGNNGQSTTYSGGLSNGALTKLGAGTQVLSGNNTYTGATTISAGQLSITGTSDTSGGITVANTTTAANLVVSGNAQLNAGGGNINVGSGTGLATATFQDSAVWAASTGGIAIGNSANSRGVLNIKDSANLTSTNTTNNGGDFNIGSSSATGAGAVFQSGGSVSLTRSLFVGAGGAGFYAMSEGSLTVTGSSGNASRFRIGTPAAGAVGVFQQSGGSVSNSAAGSLEIVNLPGGTTGVADATVGYGTYSMTGGSLVSNAIIVGRRGGQGDFTVNGGSVNLGGNSVGLGQVAANGTGILNLNGGSLLTNAVVTTIGAGQSYLTFSGGTIQAHADNASFLTGLTLATINGGYSSGGVTYAGGATIDTNGRNVTIGQSLLAPTGNGVAVDAFTPISDLVGAPYVLVVGSGSGATAQAIYDPSTRSMTGITVTNPGVGYAGTPTFQIFGGGLSGTNTVNATTFANTSGGLTKIGAGTLTLNGANTFTGPTSITAGTLAFGAAGSLASSRIDLAGSATLDVSSLSGGLTLASGQSLGGAGTVLGATTIAAGSTLSPGNSPGTLTVGDQTWAGNGNYNWQLFDAGLAAGSGWDFVSGTGSLTIAATAENPFLINLWTLSGIEPDVTGNALNFDPDASQSWTIATFAGGISGFNAGFFAINQSAFNGTGGFTNPVNGSFSVAQSGNSLQIIYAAVPEPGAVALAGIGIVLAGYTLRKRRRAQASATC